MIRVFLTSIKTSDGITLDGIYVPPQHKSRIALIWIHGLAGYFYSGQKRIHELGLSASKNNVGFFQFNTRGHDIVSKSSTGFTGAAFENFKDSVFDINAVINFAKRLGYKKIILAGHSTGANKTLFYIYKTRNPAVKGLLLLGPVNDTTSEIKRIGFQNFRRALKTAQKLAQKNINTFLPQQFGIYTAKRYLSFHTNTSTENVFPYNNPSAKWKELHSVRIPIAVVFGSREEHIDRPAQKLIEIFKKNAVNAKSFSGIIIKNADHGFHKKETELAREIINWIKRSVV